MSAEEEKQVAAEAAAGFVDSGMTVGLGTGTTAADLLPVLARRRLRIRCVATSRRTELEARELGLAVEAFGSIDRLDIAIDGADQIAPDGWLVKGGGAAHTREKIVAVAASRFVVIADSTKCVDVLHPAVPLELLAFGLHATLRELGPATLRGVAPSPEGGIIADYRGDIGPPEALATRLSSVPGLVEHGLFPPELVTVILIGCGRSVERRVLEPAHRRRAGRLGSVRLIRRLGPLPRPRG